MAASKKSSGFKRAMGFLAGKTEYDSADDATSAPEMARRKAASRGPAPKGNFTQFAKGTPEPKAYAKGKGGKTERVSRY